VYDVEAEDDDTEESADTALNVAPKSPPQSKSGAKAKAPARPKLPPPPPPPTKLAPPPRVPVQPKNPPKGVVRVRSNILPNPKPGPKLKGTVALTPLPKARDYKQLRVDRHGPNVSK
jgi:hypothetical protein